MEGEQDTTWLGTLSELQDRLSAEQQHLRERIADKEGENRHRLIVREGTIAVAVALVGAALWTRNTIARRPFVTTSLAAVTGATVVAAVLLVPGRQIDLAPQAMGPPAAIQRATPNTLPTVPLPTPSTSTLMPGPSAEPFADSGNGVIVAFSVQRPREHPPTVSGPTPPPREEEPPGQAPVVGPAPQPPQPEPPQPAPSRSCVALLPGIQLHLGECVSGVVGLVGDVTR